MGYYDITKIKKEIKKLKIPKGFFNINLDEFFSNDTYMQISIRENAGKTTSGLLFGLILKKLYGFPTEYLRSDPEQTRAKGVINLYKHVLRFGYLEKIFGPNSWNDVFYSSRMKSFYLIRRDENGLEIDKDKEPCLCIHSLAESLELKSTYNSTSNFIFFDEFMDTSRASADQWKELMDLVSTIGRTGTRVEEDGHTPLAHLLMCGNNSNLYSFWFDDFCIADKMQELKFGQYFKVKTELGSSMFVQLLDQTAEFKENVKEGRIHFWGYRTKKAAQFTGITEWSGKSYKHIDRSLKNEHPLFSRFYIFHREKWIQVELYKDEKNKAYFCFAHFALEPNRNDNIILTLDPKKTGEVFGLGEYEIKDSFRKVIHIFLGLFNENRWYYASNFVGEIFADYLKNI